MYLPATDLIPQPDTACQTRRAQRQVAADLAQVNQGRMALFLTTPSMDSLWAISPELAADANTILDQSQVARASVVGGGTPVGQAPVQGTATVPAVVRSAPSVVPLNGQTAQTFNGCNLQQPVSAPPPPAPAPVMPKPAPVLTPAGLRKPPEPTNLCWALRNGAVDASQFDRNELAKLMYRCSQLGYTGACIPPQWVTDYINANRGNLPHIAVTQATLDALPQAPDMQGVSCPDSWKMGGLAGIAPPWGDAALSDASVMGGNQGGLLDWIKAHPWISAGVGAGLVYLATNERRKGRRYGR